LELVTVAGTGLFSMAQTTTLWAAPVVGSAMPKMVAASTDTVRLPVLSV
jgi:hypothetical protein